jgi:hypothetical protein
MENNIYDPHTFPYKIGLFRLTRTYLNEELRGTFWKYEGSFRLLIMGSWVRVPPRSPLKSMS